VITGQVRCARPRSFKVHERGLIARAISGEERLGVAAAAEDEAGGGDGGAAKSSLSIRFPYRPADNKHARGDHQISKTSVVRFLHQVRAAEQGELEPKNDKPTVQERAAWRSGGGV
jgi:hypothetical protein